MSEISTDCSVCGSFVDTEDLFCANCGTESFHVEGAALEAIELGQAVNFSCSGCGASMSYDASAAALRCPFCGSVDLEKTGGKRVIKPDVVVPFRLDRGDVEREFRAWCGRGFWRPSDLASEARLTEITNVYIPFWVFRAKAAVYWTADSSETPFGARGDWVPVFDELEQSFEGVLVGASGGLQGGEVEAVAPFDLTAGVSPDAVDLEDITVETFATGRKYARPRARAVIREALRGQCRDVVPGRARNVNVNVLFSDLRGRPVLLPFWVLAYRYGEDVHRFVVNGQTGQSTGTAPISWKKIAIAVGLGVVGVLIIIVLVMSGLG